ncbi:MAG: hypothetical protein QOE59_3525 [Actinomycetota bacterium]|jgi:AcrR family transcriptional regulator|nr:hypothetical protein [Actinomycetota bacterium]
MRERLAEAARAQLREDGPLTVTAVAARAGVSRATAYRHLPSNDAVLVWATRPTETDVLLPPPAVDADGPDRAHGSATGLADRAEALIRATARWAFAHERELRAVLATSLTAESRRRGVSRRTFMQRDRWIADLLTDLPPETPDVTRARLTAALTPLFGSDMVLWTRDAAELGDPDAEDVLVWTARALITAALVEAGDCRGRP